MKATNVWLPISMKTLLVFQKYLDRLHEFLGDRVEEGILRVDLVLDQELYHLQIFVIDRHQ